MAATLEILPNEVLEIIFSKLSGLPKLPVPGWRMLDEPHWVNNLKDVVNLCCTSKRFCKVGQMQRQSAISLQQIERARSPVQIVQGLETKTMTTVKLLYAHIGADDRGAVTARLLGERIHTLSSLKHLDMCFAFPSSASPRFCCGADRDFLEAIVANLALDSYELSSFRCKQSRYTTCSHLRVWQAVSKLKVRDLALDYRPHDFASVQCPTVRQLVIGCDEDEPLSNIWQLMDNLEDFWIFDDYNVANVEFWDLLPTSVHTLGIPGCETSNLQAVVTFLQGGRFGGLRRFVAGPRTYNGLRFSLSRLEKVARRKAMQDIDTVLRARDGKAEVLGLEKEEELVS